MTCFCQTCCFNAGCHGLEGEQASWEATHTYQLRVPTACVVEEHLQVLRRIWVDVVDVVRTRPPWARSRILAASLCPLCWGFPKQCLYPDLKMRQSE